MKDHALTALKKLLAAPSKAAQKGDYNYRCCAKWRRCQRGRLFVLLRRFEEFAADAALRRIIKAAESTEQQP